MIKKLLKLEIFVKIKNIKY
jgi:hypothetical protein